MKILRKGLLIVLRNTGAGVNELALTLSRLPSVSEWLQLGSLIMAPVAYVFVDGQNYGI